MRPFYALAAVWLLASAASASVLEIAVNDASGRPAANAVVALTPDDGQEVASHLPTKAVIDQRRETFLPLVVVVRKGGSVVFTNNDLTMHQVYSFSPIKQFQFLISQGQVSNPVEFDQAGVAAIGCNIHDQMIAYVYVGDMPFAAKTNEMGEATISGLPDGRYRAEVWHPMLPTGAAEPTATVTVKGGTASLTVALPFTAKPPRAMKPMHMAY